MEELIAQLNTVDCSIGEVGGTGLAACPFDWDRIETVIFTPRNFRITEVVNLEYIQEQQQLGNMIVVRGYDSFTQTTPEPTIDTADGSGYQSVNGEMPTSFSGILNNGVVNWKALRTLNGKDNFNVIFIDVAGNMIMTQTKAGAVKGFGLKMLFTGTYKGKEGANKSQYTQLLQFSDLYEMDRMVWITNDQLDFDPSDIDGWNEVLVTIDPLAAAATSLVITPLLVDKTHLLEGTALDNWLVTKNGAPLTPSAISYTTNPGKVTFTIAAAAADDVYTVQTYDATVGTTTSNVINITGSLYKSDVATVVVP